MDHEPRPISAARVAIVAVQVFGVVVAVAWGILAWSAAGADAARTTSASTSADSAPRPSVGPSIDGEVAPLTPDALSRPAPAEVADVAITPLPAAITARVDAAWLDQVSGATGIPSRALLAYAGASIAIAHEQPSCQLGWTTLAAIGHIESNDGRYGGATLLESGYPDRQIVGPELSGGSYASIRDSDDGVWDGDPQWDRAVGPFQFIPQTWARWGADGNGDGAAEPGQIDDAALSAARYLCHAGDLSNSATWRAAIFSYNHSHSYVKDVADVANRLSAAVE